MKTLEEKLEEIKHRRIDLGADGEASDPDPCRPEIVMWAGLSDSEQPSVAVSIGALWGQQPRYLDLTPDEARRIGHHLIHLANTIDSVIDNHEPPDPPGFEAGFAANH